MYEPLKLENTVKIIFTTGYQPVALKKLAQVKGRIHLLVDEASTTALHEAFIPLSMSIQSKLAKEWEKSVEFLGSFNVIGDPMQALVDSSLGYSWKMEQLIVSRLVMSQIPENERIIAIDDPPRMFELAKNYTKSSTNIKFFFLDRTFRMPKPTEILVSIPFYNRMLTAAKDYKEVMRGIECETSTEKLINNTKFLRNIRNVLEEAVTSHYPIIYIKDTESGAYIRQRSKGLDDYDERRAILGTEIAAYLSYRTNLTKITLLTPYNEMVAQMRFYMKNFERDMQNKRKNLAIRTVHSSLGLDSDAVIAILGKERKGSGYKTIYYQSPELVNVQFSRHMKMLIIIGNLDTLAKNIGNDYPYAGRIKEAIEELKERDAIKISRIPSNT